MFTLLALDEPSVAHGAAELSGLAIENRSPRPGERRRYRTEKLCRYLNPTRR